MRIDINVTFIRYTTQLSKILLQISGAVSTDL